MGFCTRFGVVITCAVILACTVNNRASESAVGPPTRNFTAEIVSTDGTKTLVHSVVCARNHESSAELIQAARLTRGMVAETVTKHRSIQVQMGPVILELPFEIVKTIAQERENEYAHLPFAHAVVTLRDASIIKGLTFEDVLGTTEVGDFSTPIDRVATVSFIHQTEAAPAFVPRGTHSIVVHKTDGSQVVLAGATFVADVYGKEGLWNRDAPIRTFGLSTEDRARHSVEWSKIAAIVREYVDSATMRGHRWVVTLRSAQTQAGLVDENERIEGAVSFGSYKLRATVPLVPRREFVMKVKEESPAYARIEFRD